MINDFWEPYIRYQSHHAFCNAHLLRELNGITENYGQQWSEQMHDLILEIKKAMNTALDQSLSISQQLISDFEERYKHIIATGILENPVLQPVDHFVKRGRKIAVKGQKSP